MLSGLMPSVGLAVIYAGSAYGTTVLRPSLPPASWSTTRTRLLWMPSMPAAMTPLAAPTRPAARKSRRVTLIVATSLELEFRAGEQCEPAVGIAPRGADGRGGVGAEDAVELGAHRGGGVGKRCHSGRRGRREVDPAEQRRRADPAGVGRPSGDVGRGVEKLVHARGRAGGARGQRRLVEGPHRGHHVVGG